MYWFQCHNIEIYYYMYKYEYDADANIETNGLSTEVVNQWSIFYSIVLANDVKFHVVFAFLICFYNFDTIVLSRYNIILTRYVLYMYYLIIIIVDIIMLIW